MNSLNEIADQEWEVFIIGGGINGAGIARDAVMRGFKTALVERNDFASETSSRTTKLIHGGIRYLEQCDFRLVYECLQERTTLLMMAPHLVRPLPFLFPVFQGDRFPFPMIQFGTWLYSLLAGKNNLRDRESYPASETKKRYPFLASSSIRGAVRYFDAQVDDIRMCLETILSAVSEGAKVANHVAVTKIDIRTGGRYTIDLEDMITHEKGTVRARSVVNAAGPWVDKILAGIGSSHPPMLQLSKGIHLIVRQKICNDAVLLSSSDQRVIFIIPWKSGSLIGTTDTPFSGEAKNVSADKEDIDFLIREVGKITGGFNIQPSDIITTFAGVRPLAASGKKKTSKASRNHVIREWPKNLFSVAGGKYTTFRLLAQQVCDRLEIALQKKHVPCETARHPLIGSFDLPSVGPGFPKPLDLSKFNRCMMEHLIQIYGNRMKYVLAIANRNIQLQDLLCPHHQSIGAQVIFAIEHELAKTLMDVAVRRLRLDQTACRGLDCIGKVADIMAERLQWPVARKESEIQEYQSWVRKNTEFLS